MSLTKYFFCFTLLSLTLPNLNVAQVVKNSTVILQTNVISQTLNSFQQIKLRVKRGKSRALYDRNGISSFNIILQCGDIATNPGPGSHSPKCPTCQKVVRCNQKRLICNECLSVSHLLCSGITNIKIQSRVPHHWTCNNCLHLILPFSHCSDDLMLEYSSINIPIQSDIDTSIDVHQEALAKHKDNLKLMHINTQSLVSSFDEFLINHEQHKFDLIAMSETWLRDNDSLINYVSIPNYELEYNNRQGHRGGGVGCYIASTIKYHRRKDIEKQFQDIEHLWLMIQGRNKNSNMLIGVIYRSPNLHPTNEWLDKFDNLLVYVKSNFDYPILITGDININLYNTDNPAVKSYTDILAQHNLSQIIEKPTRTTRNTSTLIDHIIVSHPEMVKHKDVLPCPYVSDHDGPYVIMNVRFPKYEPRFKYIRDEKTLDMNDFLEDVKNLPFSIIYAMDDVDDKVNMFNSLFLGCIDTHAPLKRVKVTRPPAPWIHDPIIKQLQLSRNNLRYEAHQKNDSHIWEKFRESRNDVKKIIRKQKMTFYRRALSSKKPKEVWNTINAILHPPPKRISFSPQALNDQFATTAERTIGQEAVSYETTEHFISSLTDTRNNFSLQKVTYEDVSKAINLLRNDTSTGSDLLPAKFLKSASEWVCSPLTHIINTSIRTNCFPSVWKKSRVVPIPKTNKPVAITDYRPISIQPVVSKIMEKVALWQLSNHIEKHKIYKETITGFRKGHDTGNALIKLRDDIKKAMKSSEAVLAVMIDFSKAFDTISHDKIIRKLHNLGFSKDFLLWIHSYLINRQQFVQIDDIKSTSKVNNFGVPQGSILGPILFNLYVNDLQENIFSTSVQYADDTTIWECVKPTKINNAVDNTNKTLNSLCTWAKENCLSLNALKTKYMIISTKKLSLNHNLHQLNVPLQIDNKNLNKVSNTSLLGTVIDENLTWGYHVNNVLSSCYGKLSVLRKLKNMTTFKLRKQLIESLILTKIDFNDTVYAPLTQSQVNKLQRLQLSACSFVFGKFVKPEYILKLKWLPIAQRRKYNVLKNAFKAITDPIMADNK